MKVLYVHGFNGSPEGSSYRMLKNHLPEGYDLIGMDYNQDDCEIALNQIRELVQKDKIDVIVGCSLGGFLTLLVSGVERYVINPCYHPSMELPRLGAQNGLPAPTPEMVATYALFEPTLKMLTENDKQLVHCFIGHEDELFGDKYAAEIEGDLGKKPHFLFSGHHLSESAAETICCLIASDKYHNTVLEDAHKYSSCHEYFIERSEFCGCFSCHSIFPASSVHDYIRDSSGKTALCPHCFTDAVLPDSNPYPLTEGFLKKMEKRWF